MPAHATFPGRNGRIAFTTSDLPGTGIGTVAPDGGAQRVIRSGARAFDPSFSPDGRWIAFVRCDEHGVCGIHVMTAGGRRLRRVPNTPPEASFPRFAPDGRTLVYSVGRYVADSRLFAIRLDGSGKRDLGPGTAPAISPDGRRIAFLRQGRLPSGGVQANNDIHVLEVRTGRVREVTRTPVSEGPPSFSPDGRRIAFSAFGMAGFEHIYAMRADGSGRRLLTNDRRHKYSPVFSPDGHRIAFVYGGENPEVWSMNTDGTRLRRVTAAAGSIDWQPLR